MFLRFKKIVQHGLLLGAMCCGHPALAATSIPFTINMSEAVTVSGCPATCPRIAIDVGGTTRYATYTSGSGTASLIFTYQMVSGDVDLDGIALSSPIDLNGGTIIDVNGNAISNLTFTPPNTSGVKVDYPSLSMNFLNNDYILSGTHYASLSAFLTAAGGTFSRASTGTYYDSAGILQTASSNTPRLDYDPATLAAKGVLIEAQRTNLIIRSEEYNTWTQDDGSIVTDAAIAPDGQMTAEKFVTNTNLAQHRVKRTVALTAGNTYTSSVYVKKAGYDYYMIFWSPLGSANIAVNLDTGSVITSGGGEKVGQSVTPLPNGWYRVSVTLTTVNGGNYQQLNYAYNGANNFTGDGVSGIYIWGSQVEQSAFPTSYISTTASTVTRLSDDLTVPTGGWYNASEGTIAPTASIPYLGSTNNPGFASIDNGTSANAVYLSVQDSTTDRLVPAIATGNVNQYINNFGATYVAGATSKIATAFNNNDANTAKDGVLGTQDTSVTVPAVSVLRLGQNRGGGQHLNGWIENIKYYPLRVSDAQLQILTQ